MGAHGKRCRSCGHTCQTAPTQVFWRCAFWSGPHKDALYPSDWAGSTHDRLAYAQLHCHVHPDSPACPNHSEGACVDGTRLAGGELLAMREVAAGVPARVAMACAGLVSS